ncbi:type II secretion system protein GspG [bacterium]|nr:type II secretion system protein GspG [bacterium]
MTSCTRRRTRSGLTFLEIMFVVVIIGILLALVGPTLGDKAQRARIEATRAQITHLSTALKSFQMDTGRFPDTLAELAKDPDEVEDKSYHGPYMERIPTDAWRQAYLYTPGKDARFNKRTFDLSSTGPDKTEGTNDDITNWETTE